MTGSVHEAPGPRTREFRHPASQRSVIDTAKELVPTIDLADRLIGPGRMRRVGKEWVGRCPLPGHDERTPSFTVDPEKNLFFCHGCHRGGDVVRLALYAWGYMRSEDAMVAADLLREFGHDVPPRPPAWFGRQERQAPVRRAVEEAKIRRVQRRLYRWLFAPIIARFEDEDERLEEARIGWEDAGQLARLMVYQARGEKAA
jgi:hypothetical protein